MPIGKTGPTPFGYERKYNRLSLRDPEASIRLRIFELFAEHGRKKTVGEIINAEGHRTRAGVAFTAPSITRLLTDPIVLGIPGEVEQLVSKDLWDRCQAILGSQKEKGSVTRKVAHLFSGILYCGCGTKMYVPSTSHKYVCTNCRTKIARDDLEEIFHAQLETYPVPAELKADGVNLHQKWPSLSFEDKRTVVESITNRIEVTDKTVTCSLILL